MPCIFPALKTIITDKALNGKEALASNPKASGCPEPSTLCLAHSPLRIRQLFLTHLWCSFSLPLIPCARNSSSTWFVMYQAAASSEREMLQCSWAHFTFWAHMDLKQSREKCMFPGYSLAPEFFPGERPISWHAASVSPRKRETCEGFVGSDEHSVLLEMVRAQEMCCLMGTYETGLIFRSAMEVTVPAQPWPWETFQRPHFPLNTMWPLCTSLAYTPWAVRKLWWALLSASANCLPFYKSSNGYSHCKGQNFSAAAALSLSLPLLPL